VRPVNFEYQKVGHIIMLDEKDWNRIVKFLAKNEVIVQEKAVQHSAQADKASRPPVRRASPCLRE
jgi:hypothetical protein